MDELEIKETEAWQLFEHGRNFLSMNGVYTDTDQNYQFYNGNQWAGCDLGDMEPVQNNFIETIVDNKLGRVLANDWNIKFSSDNFDRNFRQEAERICDLLNKKAAKVWESDKMDGKIRLMAEDSAVNSEGIIYVDFDIDNQTPLNEVLNKCDVHYGNEQNEDIQSQPYIIVSKRVPVLEARKFAEMNGATQEELSLINGDRDSFYNAGADSKWEKDPMCTIVTKMWKENGTVWFSKSVRFLEIKKATNSGLRLYPLIHLLWKHKKGSARGEGEVKHLIPNQKAENNILLRTNVSIKQNAYPQKIYDVSRVANPTAVGQVGGIVKTSGTVDNVQNVFGYIQPAQMSGDVFKFMGDLISVTRELRNAGDMATGGVNPEQASGKAILAVQHAMEQPLNKQVQALKDCVEELARIWLDMWIVYTSDTLALEEEKTDPLTGETYIELVNIPKTTLENLKGIVKVDVSPQGSYDNYAREMTLENFLQAGLFNVQRLSELEAYVKVLPDNAVAPKIELEEIIAYMKEEQMKIAQINAQVQTMQMRAKAFMEDNPEAQMQEVQAAEQQMEMERQASKEAGKQEAMEELAKEQEAVLEGV